MPPPSPPASDSNPNPLGEVATHFQSLCGEAGIHITLPDPTAASPHAALTSPRSVLGALHKQVGKDLRRRSLAEAEEVTSGLETHLDLLRQAGEVPPEFLASPRGVASTPATGLFGTIVAPEQTTVWIAPATQALPPRATTPEAQAFPFQGVPGSRQASGESPTSYTGFNLREQAAAMFGR